jgi:putative ABC transport system substrate-binding protein
MKAKILVYALLALFLATHHLAEAQQPKKIPRIGYLTGIGSAPNAAFLQGLRDLGYVEGKNILIEFRTTGGKSERRPELAAELVQLKVDVIVADTAGEVAAAKNATATIPIVMRSVSDPIALGLVASLAHPGANITGVAGLAPELSGKRVELLKEVIPKLSRVALLAPPVKAWRTSIKETEVAAQALGLQLQILQVSGPDELGRI